MQHNCVANTIASPYHSVLQTGEEEGDLCEHITVEHGPQGNTVITYRVYFAHDVAQVQRNEEIDMRWPEMNWCGDVVVVRCSQRSHDRFVNMRAGDDVRSLQAIHQ